MKKLASIIVALAITSALVSCGQSSQPPVEQPAAQPAAQPAEQPAAQPAEQPAAQPAEQPAQDAKKVIIGLDDSFPPMGFRDESGKLVGFDIDLAEEACRRMGAEPQFQPIDWGSKELEMSSKKIDLLWNGVTITPARQEIWAFTEPYIANRQVIIVKNGSSVNSKADLAGKKIGVQKESSAVEAMQADEAVFASFGEVLEYPDNVSAFMDLDIGRTDAVVADEILARYYITQQGPDFKVLEDNFGDEDYGVAGRLDDTELMAGVQKALDDMKQDGKYQEIYKKWFGE